MTEQNGNGRVTTQKLYDELQPIKTGMATLRNEVKWLKYLMGLALLSNVVGAFGGPTPPEQASLFLQLL